MKLISLSSTFLSNFFRLGFLGVRRDSIDWCLGVKLDWRDVCLVDLDVLDPDLVCFIRLL